MARYSENFSEDKGNNRIDLSFDSETGKLNIFVWDGQEATRLEMTWDNFNRMVIMANVANLKSKMDEFKPVKGMIVYHPVTKEIPKGWKECTNFPRPVMILPGGAMEVDNQIYIEYVGNE